MAAQSSDLAAGGGLCALYTYGTINFILNCIGPIINLTVPDDMGDTKQLRSVLLRWTNVNPLTNSASKTDERAQT